MPYTLSYFKDVKLDVKDAKVWYKKQQVGLENRFADSIKNALVRLQQNPFVFAVRYKNIRIAHPKVFPYSIHFFVDDDKQQIVIIAIVHNKRKPAVAKKRIR